MGFFGKIFDKKECSVCGGEIGLLGNRKLEDGNLCKECAKKLSPWFDDRRHSTVEQIENQLKYREENQKKVEAFCVSRTLGEDMKLLIDEDAGCFMVTNASRLAEANPDVISFADVTGCVLDIDEDRTELMREGNDGEEISYNPPRYEYDYDFYIVIHVRNPYFDEIRFRLNGSDVTVEEGRNGASIQFGGTSLNFGNGFDPTQDVEYCKYKNMGEEIVAVFQQVRDDKVAAKAPKASITCPFCGALTVLNANNCCEFCGGVVEG